MIRRTYMFLRSRCGRADSVMDSHTSGPGFKTRLVLYFLLSYRLLTTITASSWAFAVVWGRSGRISWSCLTQDIKMGSCVFQCDVPHKWIAQQQVGPVSVYCVGMGCHVLCLRHGISVWQHIGQMFKSDVKPKQKNKKNICFWSIYAKKNFR